MWTSWGGKVEVALVGDEMDANLRPPYDMSALICGER